MQNTKILEMINNGQIEKLKTLIQEEIFLDVSKDKPGVNFRFVTMDNRKVTCWCETNILKTFRDFMQFVLDGCNCPEVYFLWDVNNDKIYNMYQIATEVYGMRKRTFDEKTSNTQTGKWFIFNVKKENIMMKKLRGWIETWIDGKQVKEIENVTLSTIFELIDIYNAIARKEKPSFINGIVKEILEKCGIKTIVDSIGWRIA